MEHLHLDVGGLVFDAWADGPSDGRLVLLLHGFPQDSREWAHQQAALAEAGYRAVAVDQRGYSAGARPAGVEHYRQAVLAADAAGFVAALGEERADVVGHDWGASVAWQLAGRHPERVRSLVTVSVPHPYATVEALADPDQQARVEYIRWFRRNDDAADRLLADDAARLRAFFDGSRRVPVEQYVDALRDRDRLDAALRWYRATGRDAVEGLGRVTAPTLHVWSTDDPALGRTGAEATGKHVDGPYRFEVLDGVSHWVPEDAAEELTALVLEHLAAH